MSPGLAFASMWVGFGAYLGVLAAAPALGGRLIWGAILTLAGGFALAPVLLSHDVYSYVDYARLAVAHGLDPYVHPPAAAPADPAYPLVTWRHTTSVYGPLFTLGTYPLAWLSVGAAVAALKGLAAFSVVGVAAMIARLAAARGIEPLRAAAFVALNPIVLVHVVGGAHNDGVAMLLVMVGVAAALAAREAGAGAAFVAAAAIKASAGLAAPFALLGTRPAQAPATGRNGSIGGRGRFLVGAGVVLIAAVAVGYAAFGWHWLDAFRLAGENQSHSSHMSLPVTASRLTGLGSTGLRIAALVLYAILLAHLLAWTRRGNDWLRAAAWGSFGLLLASGWLLPWYLIWALPLVALSRDRPLQFLALVLTAFQLGARIPP